MHVYADRKKELFKDEFKAMGCFIAPFYLDGRSGERLKNVAGRSPNYQNARSLWALRPPTLPFGLGTLRLIAKWKNGIGMCARPIVSMSRQI